MAEDGRNAYAEGLLFDPGDFLREDGWEERFLSLVGRFLSWRGTSGEGWPEGCRDPRISRIGSRLFLSYSSEEWGESDMASGISERHLLLDSFRYMLKTTGTSSPEELDLKLSSSGF